MPPARPRPFTVHRSPGGIIKKNPQKFQNLLEDGEGAEGGGLVHTDLINPIIKQHFFKRGSDTH